jgi:hypothetical protein
MFCIGGSAFSIVGGGGSLCLDSDGFSACAEVGLGTGGGLDFDPFGDKKESHDLSVKAEGSLEVLGFGVEGEFRVSRCTGISSSGGFNIPGGNSYEIENRYNPNTGQWEGGEFESSIDKYEAAKTVVDNWTNILKGSADLGYSAELSYTMEGCLSF